MTLGEKIQALRKQRNISQEQLADQMNVTRQAVSKWELGESMPDIENIVRLSGVLDVSTDYLLKDLPTAPTQTWQFTQENNQSSSHFVGHYEDEYEPDEDGFHIRGRFRLNLAGAIYPIAVLAYLFLGFSRGLWHPGWLIFVFAWIVEEIVDFIRTGSLHISIYGVAGAAFLVLGFVFGWWNYAWMVFVLAWVVDEMVVREKPRTRTHRRNDQ